MTVAGPLPDPLAGWVDDLRSPDPALRDDGAFTALAGSVSAGDADEHLSALGDAGTALLGDQEVQARTFGALLVALVVERGATADRELPHLDDWLAAFSRWYAAEDDLRGYDPTLGWLHAVAHGADALGAFAASPALGADELAGLLDLAVSRLRAPTNHHLVQAEDDRLAHAVVAVLRRDLVPLADVTASLDRAYGAWRDGEAGPVPAQTDNTMRFLRTLHLQLLLGTRTEPDGPVGGPRDRDALVRHLEAGLAELFWFYGEPA